MYRRKVVIELGEPKISMKIYDKKYPPISWVHFVEERLTAVKLHPITICHKEKVPLNSPSKIKIYSGLRQRQIFLCFCLRLLNYNEAI